MYQFSFCVCYDLQDKCTSFKTNVPVLYSRPSKWRHTSSLVVEKTGPWSFTLLRSHTDSHHKTFLYPTFVYPQPPEDDLDIRGVQGWRRGCHGRPGTQTRKSNSEALLRICDLLISIFSNLSRFRIFLSFLFRCKFQMVSSMRFIVV